MAGKIRRRQSLASDKKGVAALAIVRKKASHHDKKGVLSGEKRFHLTIKNLDSRIFAPVTTLSAE